MLDLLIRGGLVIDGTGNPGFFGDVAVENERVRILRGDTSGIEARRRIDATGHVVCPGFIDMHAHSGLVILAEPQHEPKVRQGITTELIGVDGNSYAPVPLARRLPPVRPDQLRPRRQPTPARALVHRGAVPRHVHAARGGERGVHRRQLAAANRRARLGRPARDARRAGQHEGAPPHRDGGGCLRHVDRSRLPPGELCRHRRADRAVARGGPARRDLPHARALQPRRPLPRSLSRGPRHRQGQRLPGPHHALLPPDDVAGRRQPDARPRRGARGSPGSTSPSTATPTTSRPRDCSSWFPSGRTTAGPSG
jgi:hypothetical protein